MLGRLKRQPGKQGERKELCREEAVEGQHTPSPEAGGTGSEWEAPGLAPVS